jgi:hypothetical protein
VQTGRLHGWIGNWGMGGVKYIHPAFRKNPCPVGESIGLQQSCNTLYLQAPGLNIFL